MSALYESVNANRQETCQICEKVVYLAERMQVESMFVHKNCFRCSYCNQPLRLGECGKDKDLDFHYPRRFFCKTHLRLPLKEKISRIERCARLMEKNNSRDGILTSLNPGSASFYSPNVTKRKDLVPASDQPVQHTATLSFFPAEHLRDRTVQRMRDNVMGGPISPVSEVPSVDDRTPERAEFSNHLRKSSTASCVDLVQPQIEMDSLSSTSDSEGELDEGRNSSAASVSENDASISDEEGDELGEGDLEELERTVLQYSEEDPDRPFTEEQVVSVIERINRRRNPPMSTPGNSASLSQRSDYTTVESFHTPMERFTHSGCSRDPGISGRSSDSTSNGNSDPDIFATPPSTVLAGDIKKVRKAADLERLRTESRLKAKLKTDEELGLGHEKSVSVVDETTPSSVRSGAVLQNVQGAKVGLENDQVLSKRGGLFVEEQSILEDRLQLSNKGEVKEEAKQSTAIQQTTYEDAGLRPRSSVPDSALNMQHAVNRYNPNDVVHSESRKETNILANSLHRFKMRREAHSRDAHSSSPTSSSCTSPHPTNTLPGTELESRDVPLAAVAPSPRLDSDEGESSAHISLNERNIRLFQRRAEKIRRQHDDERRRGAQEIQRGLQECEIRLEEIKSIGQSLELKLIEDPENEWAMDSWFALVHERELLKSKEEMLRLSKREVELEVKYRDLNMRFKQLGEGMNDNLTANSDLLAAMLAVVEEKKEVNRLCGKQETPSSNISKKSRFSKRKKKRRLLSETQNTKEDEKEKQENSVELISQDLVADVKREVIDRLLLTPLLLKLSLVDASWDELCVERLKRAKWNKPMIEIACFFRNKNPFLRTFVNVEEQGNVYAKTFHDEVRLLVRKLRYLMEAKWKSEEEESPFMLESFTPYALGWLCSYSEEQLPRCPVILQEKIRDLFLRDFPRTSEYIYSPSFLKSETFIDMVASRRDVITTLNLGDLELNDRSLVRLKFPNLKELIWHNADMLELSALFKFNQPKYECFKLDITHLKLYCHAMPVVSLDYYLPQLMMGINDAMTSIHSLDLFVHCAFSASMPTSWVLEGHQKNSCSKLRDLTHFSFHIDGFCVFYDLDCHLPPSLTCVSISVTLPPVGAQRSVSSLMAFVKRLANVNAYPDLEELHLQVWGIRCAEQLLNQVADYLSDVRRLSIIAMPVSEQRERLIDLIRHVASSCPRLVSLKLSVEMMLILVEEYGDLWKHNWRLAIARVAADCGMRDSCDFGIDALPHVSGCDEFIVKPTYPKDSNIELDLAGLVGFEDEEEEEEESRANYMQDSDSCSNDSFVVDDEGEGSEEEEEDEIDLLDQELESETDRRHQRYLKKKSRLPSSSSEEEQADEDDEDGSDVEYVTDYEDEENEQQHPLIDGEAEEVESDLESEEESEREPEGDDNELSSDQGMLDREAEEVESGLESEDGSDTEPEGEDAAFSSDQEMLVNCSCILISGEPINATDEVFMYFMGHQFPFYLFSQARISILLLIAYRFTSSLNPCMVDRDACLPIEDFEVNCSCILISGEPINATDEVFMYFMGHQFPFYLFSQIFREKLNLRIPAAHDFETSLDMPEAIYKNLRFEENMALFLINSSRTTDIIRMLINESYIRTREMRENSDKWCTEGECAVFLHAEEPFNKTVGIYAQTVDLFHVVELGGRSIVAVSSVYADFEVPKVHEIVCKNKCRRFYWNEGILCRQQCSQGLRYDQVAVTGTLKRNFVNFVRAAAVQNFRAKYSKYLH
ncbi:unnamed protein product [Haemonchus placei]|uniref:LIM zinc-binding domain-containing protein n=1 Tax=Haemonchus placei TaxID=6290 RepID=A0A158QQD3_HAEPC|nr:unnamed protein product [Haemonchus placei]